MARRPQRIGRSTTTSTKAYGITPGGAIKCGRVALLLASRGMRSTAGWVLSNCVVSGWSLVRESGDEIQSESRMRRAIRTSGLMSGDGKWGDHLRQHSRPSSTLPVPTVLLVNSNSVPAYPFGKFPERFANCRHVSAWLISWVRLLGSKMLIPQRHRF
jgi:hypothetical protein